ncbi:MAG: DUF4244 domain-containing protein [Cellulomonadaceae bacterium]|jgi:hypothetical protein|nr:DUF4244 domain-containing protein [Cellulomonadaceae bacterium]
MDTTTRDTTPWNTAGIEGLQAPSPWEEGLATAEYAVATIGAVAFAGLLIAVLRSDGIRSALQGIIETALSSF